MNSEDQSINFTYGFELRGERQVERGLDGIIEKFARTGSFADLAGASLEKFGRIFEVGLPLALGAAALGIGIEKLYEVGEEAIKTREKIDKLTAEPVGDLDISGLEENLSQLGDEMQEMGTEHGKGYAEGFGSAIKEGYTKWFYNNVEAMAWNNAPNFVKDYSPAGMLFKYITGASDNDKLPSYDQVEGNTGKLSDRAREDLSALHERYQKQQARLERREEESPAGMVAALMDQVQKAAEDGDQKKMDDLLAKKSLLEKTLDPATTGGKLEALLLKSQVAEENRSDSQVEDQKAQQALSKFTASLGDGHEVTQEEMKKGVELEKKANEARRQFNEDKMEANETAKAIADFDREQLRFNKGEVVSSHTHAIGGGGGVWVNSANGHGPLEGYTGRSIIGRGGLLHAHPGDASPPIGGVAHYSGLGSNHLSAGMGGAGGLGGADSMKTIDYLKRFNHQLGDATEGLQGVSIKNLSSSTPTF